MEHAKNMETGTLPCSHNGLCKSVGLCVHANLMALASKFFFIAIQCMPESVKPFHIAIFWKLSVSQ